MAAERRESVEWVCRQLDRLRMEEWNNKDSFLELTYDIIGLFKEGEISEPEITIRRFTSLEGPGWKATIRDNPKP